MPDLAFDYLISVIEGKGESSYLPNDKIDYAYYETAAEKYGIPYKCGKILFSMLLPKKLNYKRGDVEIRNGILVKGSLKAEDVSNRLPIAISMIDKWKGTNFFVDRGYALLSEYISRKGITISALDYVMPKNWESEILPENYAAKFAALENRVAELERLKVQQTKSSAERTEENIILVIKQNQEEIETIFKKGEYSKRDISIVSYVSGARGNIGSITSGVTMVGQMFSSSGRLGQGIARLSYYSKERSTRIEDNGFIKSSYANGLVPKEVMSLAGPAIEAAFRTYLGTPKSGHASRQIIVAMSSIILSSSLSVVTQSGKVLDALYGYGCDPAMISLKEISKNDKFEGPIDALQLLDYVNSL
jgi:DNA-directed RNA polymerase beta' subunit